MLNEMRDKDMVDKIFSEFPEINTERLNLRAIKQEDKESIYEILSNFQVVKYDTFELFTNIKQSEDMINWFNKAFEQKQAIFWGITLKNSTEIIGFCKCEIEIPKVRADFGYNLHPKYWNKGIMTEALSAIMNFTFNSLDVNRIEAAVSTENIPSIKLLKKLGFMQEGILRKRSYCRGSYHDMIMFSILKKEYLITI